MSSSQITFTDAAGMGWSLTVLSISGTRFVLTTSETASGILIAAEKAVLALDESNNETPFSLELDDNCIITLTTEVMKALDEFLQTVDEIIGESA